VVGRSSAESGAGAPAHTVTAAGATPVDPSAAVYTISPSGRIAVVFRKDAGPGPTPAAPAKRSVEIWCRVTGALLVTAPIDGALHGDVYSDGYFGEVAWSPDEAVVVYVADRPATKVSANPFEAIAGAAPLPSGPLGGASPFDFGEVEHLGERYEELHTPRLFLLDVASGRCARVPHDGAGGVAGDAGSRDDRRTGGASEGAQLVGQPSVAGSRGSYRVAYTVWSADTRRLGMIYCYNRRSAVWVASINVTSPSATPALQPAPAPANPTTPGGSNDECVTVTARLRVAGEGSAWEPAHIARWPRWAGGDDAHQHLVFLSTQRAGYFLHNHSSQVWCSRLNTGDLTAAPPQLLHDSVSTPTMPAVEATPGSPGRPIALPGLYISGLSPSPVIAAAGQRYVACDTTSFSRSVVALVPVGDTSAGSPVIVPALSPSEEARFGGSGSGGRPTYFLLSAAVSRDGTVHLLVSVSSPSTPTAAYLLSHPPGATSLAEGWTSVAVSHPAPSPLTPLAALQWRLLRVPVPPLNDSGAGDAGSTHLPPMEALLMWGKHAPAAGDSVVSDGGPSAPAPAPTPLLVVPHGGPHSTFTGDFIPGYAFAARQGEWGSREVECGFPARLLLPLPPSPTHPPSGHRRRVCAAVGQLPRQLGVGRRLCHVSPRIGRRHGCGGHRRGGSCGTHGCKGCGWRGLAAAGCWQGGRDGRQPRRFLDLALAGPAWRRQRRCGGVQGWGSPQPSGKLCVRACDRGHSRMGGGGGGWRDAGWPCASHRCGHP